MLGMLVPTGCRNRISVGLGHMRWLLGELANKAKHRIEGRLNICCVNIFQQPIEHR
jgi:hypothetical protein